MLNTKSIFTKSKLKHCVREKISDGPHETPEFIDKGIPFLSVDGIQNGKIVLENCRFISDNDHKKYNKKIKVEENDILMGKAASIGKIARVTFNRPISVWSPLAIIKCKTNIVSPIFLEYLLKSNFIQDQIQILSTSNTQKNISMRDIESIEISYPNLIEQKLISQYLDKKTKNIDSLIEKIEKKIELLKEQKTALIHQYVTNVIDPNVEMKNSGVEWIGNIPKHWIVKKIGYVANLQTGNTPSKSQEDIFFTEDKSGLPWVKPTDLNRSFGGVSSSELYLTVNGQKESRLIKKDSILICCIGNTSGKTSICNCDLSTNQQINSITFNKEVLPRYGLYYMNVFGRDLLKWMNFVTLPMISKGELSHQPIIIPPIEEQEKIYIHLDEILSKSNALENFELKKINLLSEYRQSLISSVVTGKIRITEDMV